MSEQPIRFVFLTLPTSSEPVLNLSVGGEHPTRYLLDRHQLYSLNAQIADALLRGEISERNQFRHPSQMQFDFQDSA